MINKPFCNITIENSITKQIWDDLGYVFWQTSPLFQYKISLFFFSTVSKELMVGPAPKICNCDFQFVFISNYHWCIVCQIINDSIFYMTDLMNSRFLEFGGKCKFHNFPFSQKTVGDWTSTPYALLNNLVFWYWIWFELKILSIT